MSSAPREKALLLEPEPTESGETETANEMDAAPPRPARRPWRRFLAIFAAVTVLYLLLRPRFPRLRRPYLCHGQPGHSPFGRFPQENDPFHFIPCTKESVLPALDDPHPERTWAKTFDTNPRHWSWGNVTEGHEEDVETPHHQPYRPHNPHHPHNPDKPGEPGGSDESERLGRPGRHRHPRPPHENPYADRGIYLCGFIDVPLDYTNKSDKRISRLAVTKYQVSGLALRHPKSRHDKPRRGAGTKSERTIVIEPGGPGGSGTSMAWRSSEAISQRLSGGKYDVLGWDPRGVNASLPAISCFPYDVDRDHWSVRMSEYRETSPSPRAQLEFFDAMSDSVFNACKQIYQDIPRFVSTAFVARDLEQIRLALGEDALTGYLVSYGTGIGQTYANMFPDSVGRMILDGTEYVRDGRLLGGFGWTALDNGTHAFHDGLLGECVNAGPDHCALAKPVDGRAVTLDHLQKRMETLIRSLIKRPLPSYTASSGPSLITYSTLVGVLYSAMYNAKAWPALAQMLFELEAGNTTLAAVMLERSTWEYDPTKPPPPSQQPPASGELGSLVICADQYDAPEPEGGLDWYESLWANMTAKSWIAGNSRFQDVFPCRHFTDYWSEPAEVYRGDLNKTLSNPVLLIAETYDPATPLRNGRRLLNEMGRNARLIAHHGYGHSSRDTSACTDEIAKAYILEGALPDDQETACYADEKPYLYGVKGSGATARRDPLDIWDEHLRELAILNPRLLV
ncbi:protease [Metarhizium album ARSEF 1941]|uniref:Protease n=1 Tax=Metarhizium album (strain ARSEF 1941) TaxID=1081103 RepID=A0A0B2WL40_METAS|nr:protease [Metarhizium album ARSEF 1941]KHN94668.1 protease [Metarhizium album ARSEF 1941]